MPASSPNITSQGLAVSIADREALMGQKGAVLWFWAERLGQEHPGQRRELGPV